MIDPLRVGIDIEIADVGDRSGWAEDFVGDLLGLNGLLSRLLSEYDARFSDAKKPRIRCTVNPRR
ncbi:hypothetical protein BZL30_7331 [Mycobacterium kansasii]|uniref:Uncharacterized protein n=1 Tax=Mycobacterium kansasii TaxID=1768 RepID=A0A1V3WPP2_MYCKA|nr:hypothetical protein BZL30_7331 [Mycobacterium kansasii]